MAWTDSPRFLGNYEYFFMIFGWHFGAPWSVLCGKSKKINSGTLLHLIEGIRPSSLQISGPMEAFQCTQKKKKIINIGDTGRNSTCTVLIDCNIFLPSCLDVWTAMENRLVPFFPLKTFFLSFSFFLSPFSPSFYLSCFTSVVTNNHHKNERKLSIKSFYFFFPSRK